MTNVSTFLALSLSFFIAFVLSFLPLPPFVKMLWPAWVLLVLFFWVMVLPNKVSIFTAAFLGLIMDVIQNTLLGEHVFAFVLMVMILLLIGRQNRVLTQVQQMMVVFSLVLFYEICLALPERFIGLPTPIVFMMIVPMTSALIWPLLSMVLKDYRHRFLMN